MAAMLLSPLAILASCLPVAHAAQPEPLRPVDLRCEYLGGPIGIDALKPGLSWKLKSDLRGQKQTAYQVLVASSLKNLDRGVGDLWDSEKVNSDQSTQVVYDGKPLTSRMHCYWKVRVWDRDGKESEWSDAAVWTMGLVTPGDWQAQWIGAPDLPSESEKLIVKKATYRTLDGSVTVDVTGIMKRELAQNGQFLVEYKKLGGDPAPNIVKELVVEYVRNGKPGTVRARDFQPLTLPATPPGTPAPLFRKEFDLAASPDSAFVTVHSPAYFELYINGTKVGKDVLTPAVSKHDIQTFYVTYDVCRYLKPGRNCIGLWLGKGWADRVVVRAQLDAVLSGRPITIGTDTSWQSRHSGLYKIGGWKWGDFGGERLDARDLIPDWSTPGTATASWKSAVSAKGPRGPARSQPCPLNRIGKEISAVAVTTLDKYSCVIDFGTVLTGWFRLKMPALEPGAVVKMTFADAGPGESRCNKGYQHFNQVSEFVSAGKAGEVFQNKFNYAAFRYVIVEGVPSVPDKEDAVAFLVESDLEEAGSFECSNELLNRIHRVNQWTQRCLNLGGYYVDCQHRERMGYGDGQVAVEGFMTSFRADGYYRKWLRDWRLLQTPDGNLPHTAPFGSGGGGPGWGGLFSAITWRHYLYYGDRRVLEENYDAVRRYVDYLESKCKEGVMRKYGGQWDFIGDWVPPGRGMDTKKWPGPAAAELFNNCYRINQMELLTKMADAMGKSDDVRRYREILARIRPLVHAAFYNANRQKYVVDEQAYYVMPLMAGIVPEDLQETLLKKLRQNILVKNKGHLDTGMLGTYFMMEYLREIGQNDLVLTMFTQTTYPGWGYMLEQGATTFWEQWNGFWSHAHSCFTSPDNWLYQGLAGIQADPNAPGMKHVIIKPAILDDLTWVKAHHDSPYGRIISHWKREGDRVTLEVTIPPNSTATVYVPAKDAADVTVNGRTLKEADQVIFLRLAQGSAVVKTGSGSYTFVSTCEQSEPHKVLRQQR
jgi:alpha-L-rhamnosidase